jgi:pimeloyl-ACP methyl ester carboxylesterase
VTNKKSWRLILLFFLIVAPLVRAAEEQIIKEGLAIRMPRLYQRSLVAIDPVEAMIAAGQWKAPKPGESLVLSSSETTKWNRVTADADGWFTGPAVSDGYIYAQLRSDRERVMILNGLGDVYVFFNGELRMGAKYAVKETYESWEPRFDYGQVPVLLKKGENRFLFRCTRGRLKAVLSAPAAPILLNEKDVTVPDFLVGESAEAWGAIVVMNATNRVQDHLVIIASGEGLESTTSEVGILQPFSVRKVGFRIRGASPEQPTKIPLKLTLGDGEKPSGPIIHSLTVPLEWKSPLQNHKRTFRSKIEGSVQYYAVNPAQDRDPEFKPALALSVHGAGVEAVNQAGSYKNKPWLNIVAPTNRRPYGFDWEDWGRLDALEAMEDFTRRYPSDPGRLYLTGHSMGGHGAWILGVLFPDRFAAIGPSAGWISFRTYASRQKEEGSTDLEKLAARPLLQGDTLALVRNTINYGVFILHGEKDESVPVAQSRQMAKTLAEFHKDFIYHEEKDASHWWDKSDEPGVDCVDWPPMFDFFARHALPRVEMVRDVEFVTPNPGISARCRWARIDAQTESLKLSSIRLRLDPGRKRFSGTTQNVARLALDLSMLGQPDSIMVDIDGQQLKVTPREQTLWLYNKDSSWSVGEPPSPGLKGAERNGPFKDAFRHRMIFVFGTQGTTEENAWAFGKARFDAEIFQYQGNGSVEFISDREFRPESHPDRNVILYGNASTNRAWKLLLAGDPVLVDEGFVKAGRKRIAGKDLACLFIRPRSDSRTACVGVVAGTGIQGMRLTNTRPYLSAGYALPDMIVFNADVGKGSGRGIKLAGFFGLDWGVESGEFIWE